MCGGGIEILGDLAYFTYLMRQHKLCAKKCIYILNIYKHCEKLREQHENKLTKLSVKAVFTIS